MNEGQRERIPEGTGAGGGAGGETERSRADPKWGLWSPKEGLRLTLWGAHPIWDSNSHSDHDLNPG